MEQPPIVFVSGLPRSGSTLLMNLLGQNPRHHVTPTNGLLDLITLVRDNWATLHEFKAQGLEVIQPRIVSLARAMIEGFYREEFKAGKVVFDKSRGWLAYMEMMEGVLQRPINIVVTVRDVRAIIASFEKLYRQTPMITPRPENYIAGQTMEGRAALLLSDVGTVGLAINRLRDALRRQPKSRIMMIPYNQLCRNPQSVLSQLHQALGLPAFKYDPDHVRQITQEDDLVHGLPLHNIRERVELGNSSPWIGVLSEPLCQQLSQQFSDIQQYSEVT